MNAFEKLFDKKWSEIIAAYYKAGFWSKEMVLAAVEKGKITQEEANNIINN